MSKSQIFDVLIIGGGPAGLSAAYGLARLLHSVVLFDSGVYRNARSSHMHADLLARYNTTRFQDVKVESISRTNSGLFKAIDATKAEWLGRKIILATGVRDIYPDIEGYDECWAYGIFHCLFCHGYESRGAPSAGILAIGTGTDVMPAMHVAHNAAQLASTVTIYTHANPSLFSSMSAATSRKSTKFIVDNRKIVKLVKSPNGADVIVHLEDGTEKIEGFLVHRPFTEVNGPFAAQLGCELTEHGDYKTTYMFGETTVHGVFAAGDCATMIKAVTAMYLGNMVAAGLAGQLEAETEE